MKFKYICILLLAFLAGSCGDKFLDEAPTTAVGDNDLIKTEADLDNIANGCYHYFLCTSGAYGYYYNSYYMFSGDLMGDDFRTERTDWMGDYYAYNSTAYNIGSVLYRNVYALANHVTVALKSAETLPDTQTKAELLAELHVLRALGHFDVARLWGPLPSNIGEGKIKEDALGVRIYDVVPEDIRENSYRDKASEVYAFINKELNEWVPKLSKTKKEGRLDYYGGLAFRARFNLFTENWDVAMADALEIMNSGKYSLYKMEDYVGVWQKEFTSESIFEIRVTDTEPNEWVSLGTLIGGTRYKMVGTTKDFEALMAADPNDVRFKLYVWESSKEYYVARWKYEGRGNNEKVVSPKLFRLSEMYLIASEAAMRLGKADAGKYLSDLREKRTTTNPRKYDAGVTLDDILYERRVELACEGHRAWDLWRNKRDVVRWRTPEEKLEKKHLDQLGVIPFDHDRRIWPMSERELLLLPESERAGQQNPGY